MIVSWPSVGSAHLAGDHDAVGGGERLAGDADLIGIEPGLGALAEKEIDDLVGNAIANLVRDAPRTPTRW